MPLVEIRTQRRTSQVMQFYGAQIHSFQNLAKIASTPGANRAMETMIRTNDQVASLLPERSTTGPKFRDIKTCLLCAEVLSFLFDFTQTCTLTTVASYVQGRNKSCQKFWLKWNCQVSIGFQSNHNPKENTRYNKAN